MEGDILTLEQHFQLRQLWSEIQACSREELMHMVLEERQMLLVERQLYRGAMESMGFETAACCGDWVPVPQSEEELIEVFGKIPSDEELADYLNDHLEAARMEEINIEAIALGLED